MPLDRRERLVCLRALRLAEDYYKILIRQPVFNKDKGKEVSAVIRALKLAIQNDRSATLFPARRCPACERLESAEGMDEVQGQ